jgi:hypothetical protein
VPPGPGCLDLVQEAETHLKFLAPRCQCLNNVKFNARRFFDAFHGHENELSALFAGFDRPLPEPVTTEGACRAASEDFGADEKLTPADYPCNPAGCRLLSFCKN